MKYISPSLIQLVQPIYLSKLSTTKFLRAIGFHNEEHTYHLNKSQFYSILAYESSDISSKEELAVCGRWLENGKVVECFLGIVHVSEVNAKALTEYLLSFLNNKLKSLHKICDLGFDGANSMSSEKSGTQKHMRCVVPNAFYNIVTGIYSN